MASSNQTIFERAVGELPGWIFMIAGLVVVAGALLVPSWLKMEHVHYQLYVMQAQNSKLQKQVMRYTDFEKALSANNPTVLKRLALVQFHKLPDNGKVIKDDNQFAFNDYFKKENNSKIFSGKNLFVLSQGKTFDSSSASVSQWLATPVAKQIPNYQNPNTLLVRLGTGSSRWILLASGLFCLIGGIFWRCNSKPEQAA